MWHRWMICARGTVASAGARGGLCPRDSNHPRLQDISRYVCEPHMLFAHTLEMHMCVINAQPSV